MAGQILVANLLDSLIVKIEANLVICPLTVEV